MSGNQHVSRSLAAAAALTQPDAAIFWWEEESSLAVSDFRMPTECCYLFRGALLHPPNQEFRPEFSCYHSDWCGFRKISPSLYHPICSVSDSRPVREYFFKKAGSWCPVHFENWKNYMILTSIVLEFLEAFLLWGWMFVYTCESMWHRTMKILEEQQYAQCLLKKVKSLILLKDLCRIYCHGDWKLQSTAWAFYSSVLRNLAMQRGAKFLAIPSLPISSCPPYYLKYISWLKGYCRDLLKKQWAPLHCLFGFWRALGVHPTLFAPTFCCSSPPLQLCWGRGGCFLFPVGMLSVMLWVRGF